MAAVINPRPQSTVASSMGCVKPVLLHKIEGHPARVNGVFLLSKDDGVVTISDDRFLRIWLKRETDQYWPSVCHHLPFAAYALYMDEDSLRLIVGLINGCMYEFSVEEDMNSVSENRRWDAHATTITAVLLSITAQLIFSCSKDRTVVWHDLNSAVRMGSYTCEGSCTALEFDAASRFVFIGDTSGSITLLRLNGNNPSLVSKLSAHTASVSSLAWDPVRQLLFSGSSDHLVIMWDVGGKNGQIFELNAHNAKVSCLAYSSSSSRLFSSDENGTLVCWDMNVPRMVSPEWKSSDNCMICDAPFLWNIKTMWDRKIIGLRQHHCRICGIAVCGECCKHTTKYPAMGYELPVRVCNGCHAKMEEYPENFDLTPLAVISELRQSILYMHLQEETKRLITVGGNRILMLWDVSAIL
ncbi:hypothetical protein AB6A40_002486 [Gnathostoma spinigerum]|uniref:FYVE-type domain-containing protein n=1 Tax=Gnathostoma spinigerum TaxID=75299 RepID=A0ABD6E8Z5_9BILA